MARAVIRVTGAEEAARDLRQIAGRLRGEGLQALFAAMAQRWATFFQSRIMRRELTMEPLHPATRAIRRYYGHGGKPPLVRGGDLVQSIRPLEITDRLFAVGSTLRAAIDVHQGGTVTRGGRRRTLPARPFLDPPESLVDEAVEQLTDWLTTGATGEAPA